MLRERRELLPMREESWRRARKLGEECWESARYYFSVPHQTTELILETHTPRTQARASFAKDCTPAQRFCSAPQKSKWLLSFYS